MRQITVVLALVLAVPVLAMPLTASAHRGRGSRSMCQEASGTFVSQVVTDPAVCDSPVGMCTQGVLEGDLEGTYDFAFLTMTPDAADPSLVHYTARSVVTTDAGHLYGEDTGVMRMFPDGTAQFVTTVSVVYGDGCFEGVTGRIVAPGLLNLVTGEATGTYGSYLCGRRGFRRCF